MKARPIIHRASGFTLLETVIVVAVIALLAALVLSINIDPPNKRRPTEAMMPAIESCLERYHEQFGEFPQPANQDETAELMPGKVYRIGAAKCLYQALTGDGTDAIQGAGDDAKTSDGVLDDEDTKRMIFKDMPAKMRRKVGNSFILVDGYGRPFQYIKADPEKKNTVNSTYDLWSYGDDETNLRATSKDTEANPAVGAKWIKNW
jgi:prepilin-type N-terminal cleavage/methylation domain-containing protein